MSLTQFVWTMYFDMQEIGGFKPSAPWFFTFKRWISSRYVLDQKNKNIKFLLKH